MTGWTEREGDPWYDVPADRPVDVALAVMSTVRDIERRQESIHQGHRRHARMYGGYTPSGMQWQSGPGVNRREPFAATRAVVRAICDTATALISKFRPKPTILTTGADWDVQQQAEDLDQFLVGAYDRSGIYQIAPMAFRDSTVGGTGIWKYVGRGRGEDWHVAVERVLPDNLIVDEDEVPEEPFEPENTYHRKLVKTDRLVAKYAADDDLLRMKLRSSTVREWPGRSIPSGHSVLVEAIHVDPDGGPGRRVLCTDGAVLEDGPWKFNFHPYEFLWWHMPQSGFYGDGVAYRQYGLQERVTYMYRWLEKVHNLFGNPVTWVDPVGGPPTVQLSNEIGAVVHARRPPVFQPRQMVSAEVYAWIDRLVQGGFEDEGINMATAGNQLPPGVESAPAQREYNFKEANRFAPVSQRWEYAVAVGAAKKMTAMYAARARSATPPKTRWADRKLLHVIEWPDLDEASYVIQVGASSLETLAPHARIQAAVELSATNWLRPGEGRALMAHPDLQKSDEIDNAPFTYSLMVLQQLMRGEFVEVDKYANLQVLDSTIRHGRLLCKQRKAPPELIDGMSDFLDRLDLVSKQAAAEQAAMAQQAQGPMGPLSEPSAAGSPSPFPGPAGAA